MFFRIQKVLRIIPFLILSSLFSIAQEITVLDADAGNPLEGVIVRQGNLMFITDEKGVSEMENVSKDARLIFYHNAYETESKTFTEIEQDSNRIYLTRKLVRIDEIVISGNRRNRVRTESVSRIHVLDADQVWKYQPQTSADLAGLDGEVYIQKSQQGGGSPMIRGFSANRLLLVVDGVRMNNAIFRSGNLQNIVSIDPNTVETTEVIPGPGSVIYGSDAIGGVLSFNTYKPGVSSTSNLQMIPFVSARYSSASGEKTMHGRLVVTKGKWGSLLSVTYSAFDHLRMGKDGPEDYLRSWYAEGRSFNGADKVIVNPNPEVQRNTAYNQLSLMAKLRYRPNSKLDVTFGAMHSATGNVPRYDRLIVTKNGLPRYGEWYYGPQKWNFFTFQTGWYPENQWFDRLNILTGFQRFRESRHDRNWNDPILYHRSELVDVGSLNLDFEKKFSGKYFLSYGLELTANKVNSAGESENRMSGTKMPVTPRYPDGSLYETFAAYMSGESQISEVRFTGGLRFTLTHLKGSFESGLYEFPFKGFKMTHPALAGNVGMLWNPDPEWQISLNGSTGFRSPNIDDIGKVFDSEPGNVVVPNPELKPEMVYNLEAGATWMSGEKSRIELNIFRTWLDNAMVRRPFLFDGSDTIFYNGVPSKVEALVNTDHANLYGASLGIKLNLLADLILMSQTTFIHGKDSDGLPLRHIPPVYGSTGLVYEKERWYVRFNMQYNGSVSNDRLAEDEKDKPYLYVPDKEGLPYSPAWMTMNFAANYRLSQNLVVSLGIDNILNKRYRPYSSGVAAAGQSWIFSAVIDL